MNVTQPPKRRPRGRPASKNDKNGRPVPLRADRDRAVQWFFKFVPHSDFEDAMLMSGDPRFYKLQEALHDDAYRNTSPGTLCRRFGISMWDLMRLWGNYNFLTGQLTMLNQLPDVLADITEDALSHQGPCPRCDGIGHVMRENGEAACPVCDGSGEVRVPADANAVRLYLEIIGVIGPRRGRRAAV